MQVKKQVRTRHVKMDWFKIEIGVHQGCLQSPYLFNLFAEYIMQNSRLCEVQAGIKIAGRNINNLTHADDTNLTAESEEELKSLLMKVKEESEKSGLKLNIHKTKIVAPSPITSWQIEWNNGNSDRLYFWGASKITADGDHSHDILLSQFGTNLLFQVRL